MNGYDLFMWNATLNKYIRTALDAGKKELPNKH